MLAASHRLIPGSRPPVQTIARVPLARNRREPIGIPSGAAFLRWVGSSKLPRRTGSAQQTPHFFSIMSLMANLTLIYGLRLLPEGEVTEIQDAVLKLANGHQAHVTMHSIEGSRQEIEAQLKRSLDAFFDFYPEI